MPLRRRRLVIAVAFVAAARVGTAAAQTTDPIFRSWRWTEEVTAARALGLGGAITGLADDGAAAALNPAGLATLPRAGELQLGFRFRSDEALANGDRRTHETKVASPASFVLRLSSRVGLSYHFLTVRSAERIDFDDGHDVGVLRTSINGPGVGIGVRVSPFVNLGLSLDALRFYINDGRYARDGAAGPARLAVRLNSNGDTRVAGTVGALVRTRELSYGLAFRLGRRWRGLRTASDPSTSRVVDDGTSFGVRSPSILTGGVSWQPELRRAQTLLLSAQVDRVFLDAVAVTSVPGFAFPAADFETRGAFEWRAGGEVTFPVFGSWASHGPGRPNRLQIRAGWHRAAAGTVVYNGPDPVEAAVFPPRDPRHLWSVGASIGGATIWRLSGAYRFGGGERLAVVGLTVRYPGLFP